MSSRNGNSEHFRCRRNGSRRNGTNHYDMGVGEMGVGETGTSLSKPVNENAGKKIIEVVLVNMFGPSLAYMFGPS